MQIKNYTDIQFLNFHKNSDKESEKVFHWLIEMKKPVWNCQYLAKLYLHFLFDLATPLLEDHPNMDVAKIQKDMCTTLFIAELFSIEKDSSLIPMNKK